MSDSILVVYGPSNTGKIRRHVEPLTADSAVTMVCIDSDDEIDEIDYRRAPTLGVRPLGLIGMFVLALWTAFETEFDGVASFSLLPHGMVALCVGRIYGLPVHLGIIGMDLDVHARSVYGPIIKALIRRFDVVSVPGEPHREQLHRLGLPPDRTAVLTHPIDSDRYQPPDDETIREIDYLWVGRFEFEKNPKRYVEALDRHRDDGHEFTARMVGDGPLKPEIEAQLRERGLADDVELTGWVEDPVDHYRDARVFVLTSKREALPFTLIEAMATGLACIVPPIGDIPEIVDDERNALVYDHAELEDLVAAFNQLQENPQLRARLGAEATSITSECSYAAAREDWVDILRRMGVRNGRG